MKSAISRHNQSGLQLDDEAVRTIQAASRPDWSPSEQLVLVTIPDVSQTAVSAQGHHRTVSSVMPDSPFETSQWSDAVMNMQAVATLAMTPLPVTAPPAATQPGTVDVAQAGSKISGEIRRSIEEVQFQASNTPDTTSPVQAATVTEASAVSPVASSIAEPKRSEGHSAIVEALLARFGAGPSCLIHFCDIDQPRRAAGVGLSVGMEFADRTQRRVLLLDLSRTTRPLSCFLGVELAAGFREVIRTQLNWRNLVRPTSNPLVDVLPAGVIKLSSTATRADYELAVRRLAGELVLHYGGVFSCSDTAFDLETELVGLCSSGGFLTMDFQRTSRRLAKTAASHLQMSGTRLLGCIAASNSN